MPHGFSHLGVGQAQPCLTSVIYVSRLFTKYDAPDMQEKDSTKKKGKDRERKRKEREGKEKMDVDGLYTSYSSRKETRRHTE